MPPTTLSVVIPTTLRPELAGAVMSARGQQKISGVEVIVVVDLPFVEADTPPDVARALDLADRVIYTGGGKGGAHARNIGVSAASSDFTAFLDDDDLWHVDKSAAQIDAIQSDARAVASCRVVQFHSSVRASHQAGRRYATGDFVPAALIDPGEPIEDFLFARRRPNRRRASIFTSTLLMHTALAKANAWASLARHQDWDYLIKLQRESGARFYQLGQMLAMIQVGSTNSVSASSDWMSSLGWCRSWKDSWRAKTYVDFLAAQPLRYALTARSASGIRECGREMWRTRTFPSTGPTLIGLGGILGRRPAERLVVRRSTAT